MVAYAEPGYLIYQGSGALMAQPFDAARLRLNGTPTRIAESVTVNPNYGLAAFAVSADRRARLSDRRSRGSPASCNGSIALATHSSGLANPGLFWGLALSPDEKRVAVSRPDPETGRTDVWTIDLSTGVPTRVTFDPAIDDDAAWTPDGLALSFWSDRHGKYGIYQRTLGSATDVVVYESPNPLYLGDWSRDGKFLLYHNVQAISRCRGSTREHPFA